MTKRVGHFHLHTAAMNPPPDMLYRQEVRLWARWHGQRHPVTLSQREAATPLVQWVSYTARYCGACARFVIVRRGADGQYRCPRCGGGTEDRELPW